MKHMRPFSSQGQAGFSLVEIMIALTIGFMVIAGVGYLYLGSRQAFRTQDSLTAIQENARFALDTMSHDIRMAGYMGCGNISTISAASNLNVMSKLVTGSLATGTPLIIFPNGAGWTAPTGIVRAAGDVLRVYTVDSGGVTVTGMNTTTTNANIQTGGNPYNYQANDVLLVSDCSHADIFTSTGVSSSSSTVTISTASNVNNSNFLYTGYGADTPKAQIYSFKQVDYFLGCPSSAWNGTSCSQPVALYQWVNSGTPQPLVDNIENMAFKVSLDTSSSGPVAVTQTDVSPSAVANWAQVMAVQVHLLMVGGASGDTNSHVTASQQTYTFNGSTATASDNRLYQEAVATVALRNRL